MERYLQDFQQHPFRSSLKAVGAVFLLWYFAALCWPKPYAPLEVHWTYFEATQAGGYVRNATDHPVRGWSLKITGLDKSVLWGIMNHTSADPPPLYATDYAVFPVRPEQCELAPGQTMPFSVSTQYTGELTWKTEFPNLQDASGDNDLGQVKEFYP